mmetsp:Transcript_3033/g.9343  ORF Transcript_3033/g.9343 Transcript_3033/m.9343 type:complete len:237 (+) Transcript_3033:597-1307(+)
MGTTAALDDSISRTRSSSRRSKCSPTSASFCLRRRRCSCSFSRWRACRSVIPAPSPLARAASTLACAAAALRRCASKSSRVSLSSSTRPVATSAHCEAACSPEKTAPGTTLPAVLMPLTLAGVAAPCEKRITSRCTRVEKSSTAALSATPMGLSTGGVRPVDAVVCGGHSERATSIAWRRACASAALTVAVRCTASLSRHLSSSCSSSVGPMSEKSASPAPSSALCTVCLRPSRSA